MKGRVLLAVVATAMVVATACSSNKPSSSGSTTPTPTPGVVNVVEKEFTIAPEGGSFTGLAAGSITFRVRNAGTINHEFVLVKTELDAAKLPKKDGMVDESKLTSLGEIEEFAPGKTEAKAFNLTAGSYVAFCNVVGHYVSGMHAAITVS